eukprot:343373-Chlamydomonas_euryale.AAC.2
MCLTHAVVRVGRAVNIPTWLVPRHPTYMSVSLAQRACLIRSPARSTHSPPRDAIACFAQSPDPRVRRPTTRLPASLDRPSYHIHRPAVRLPRLTCSNGQMSTDTTKQPSVLRCATSPASVFRPTQRRRSSTTARGSGHDGTLQGREGGARGLSGLRARRETEEEGKRSSWGKWDAVGDA